MRNLFIVLSVLVIAAIGFIWFKAKQPPKVDSEFRIEEKPVAAEVIVNSAQTEQMESSSEYQQIMRVIENYPQWDMDDDTALETVEDIERLIQRYPRANYSELLYYEITLVGYVLGDTGWAKALCQKFLNNFPNDSRTSEVEDRLAEYK